MFPILIYKYVFEPSDLKFMVHTEKNNNKIKFMVQNHNYICTNLII